MGLEVLVVGFGPVWSVLEELGWVVLWNLEKVDRAAFYI